MRRAATPTASMRGRVSGSASLALARTMRCEVDLPPRCVVGTAEGRQPPRPGRTARRRASDAACACSLTSAASWGASAIRSRLATATSSALLKSWTSPVANGRRAPASGRDAAAGRPPDLTAACGGPVSPEPPSAAARGRPAGRAKSRKRERASGTAGGRRDSGVRQPGFVSVLAARVRCRRTRGRPLPHPRQVRKWSASTCG